MSEKRFATVVAYSLLLLATATASTVFGDQPGQGGQPARRWTVYLLPHSHVDIGYTHLQPEVERRQWANIDKAVWLSNLAEEPCKASTGPIDVPAFGIVTLRADLP